MILILTFYFKIHIRFLFSYAKNVVVGAFVDPLVASKKTSKLNLFCSFKIDVRINAFRLLEASFLDKKVET